MRIAQHGRRFLVLMPLVTSLIAALTVSLGCSKVLGFHEAQRQDGGRIDGSRDGDALDGSGDGGLDDIDAFACGTGLTACGSTCVDLETDRSNCGACGYEVISSGSSGDTTYRDCVAGKPTPAWRPIASGASAGAPTERADMSFWTGRRFIVYTPNQRAAYDPVSNTWTSTNVPSPPIDLDPGMPVLSLPDMQQVFVWSGGYAASPTGYLFDDSGITATWQPLTTQGGPGSVREPTLVRKGSVVFVLFGTVATGAAYDLGTKAWTSIPGAAACGNGPRFITPATLAGDVIVAFSGYTFASSEYRHCLDGSVLRLDTDSLTWLPALTPAQSLQGRLAHSLVSLDSKALLVGGWHGGGTGICDTRDSRLIDADAAAPEIFPVAQVANDGLSWAVAADIGRSAFLWGGGSFGCNSLTDNVLNGGALATLVGNSVVWKAVPGLGQPSPRYYVGALDTISMGADQHLWTGREMLVYGGNNLSGWQADGARYQPPAACVCPSPQPGCSNVSNVVGTCEP